MPASPSPVRCDHLSRHSQRPREPNHVGYNGTWTTDGRRALTLHDCKAAETHAALMRDRCPRNADVIKVEEVAAED
jgi:hypothetical protein